MCKVIEIDRASGCVQNKSCGRGYQSGERTLEGKHVRPLIAMPSITHLAVSKAIFKNMMSAITEAAKFRAVLYSMTRRVAVHAVARLIRILLLVIFR